MGRPPAPKKSFGQNFLSDPRILDRIADFAGAGEGDVVVEIGPGRGALTDRLLARGCRVLAVELDRELLPVLSERFSCKPGFRLLHADATTLDLPQVLREAGIDPPVTVAGNFPYNVGTHLVRLFSSLHGTVRCVAGLLQDEVARRICANPGDGDYGFLSLVCRYRGVPTAGSVVKPGAFQPPPKVLSRIFRLEIRPEPLLDGELESRLMDLLSSAFAARRKTLARALTAAGIPSASTRSFLEMRGFSTESRAEDLSLEVFLELVRSL